MEEIADTESNERKRKSLRWIDAHAFDATKTISQCHCEQNVDKKVK